MEFSKGQTCPEISKSRKNIWKGEMTQSLLRTSTLKARGREIAEKLQNISETTNHINHKTRFMLSIEEFLRVCFRLYTCF